MVYISRIRGNVDRRPKAFWGALIPAALNFVGGLITTSQQAKAQKQAIEEQKKLAQQQLNVSNQNNLSATLNNSIAAQDSYDNEDNYNLKYRNGGIRRLGSNRIIITDGGNAKKIGNNTFLLRGGSHEDINETGQTGIGINVGNNEIEAEGGEVAQKKNDSLRIFSAQPMLAGGLSPAQAILKGYNKDKVFAAQQRFKRNNHLDDDGSKAQTGTKVNVSKANRVSYNNNGTLKYNSPFTPNNGQASTLGLVDPLFQALSLGRTMEVGKIISATKVLNNIRNHRFNLSKEYRNKSDVYKEYGRFALNLLNPLFKNGGKVKYNKPDYYHWINQTSDNLKVNPIDNDYDYRAYYDSATPWELANTMYNAKNGHFTDIGKRPSHPTFSNESKYSNSKTPGGTWNNNVFVPAIWQFGNNGNRIRNIYMNNTGEGYFNGRRNVYPKYGLGGTIKNVWNFLKSNRKPTDNVAALAIAYQLFNPNSNYNKQKGKFNGGNFEGSGAGGTWTKDYKPKKGFDNFNDAYDDAVDHNAETFIFGNKRYNTLKENNPIRELNNRAVGSWRDSVVTKDRNGYGKDFGPIKGAASLFPIITETYNPKRSRRRCGGRIKAEDGTSLSLNSSYSNKDFLDRITQGHPTARKIVNEIFGSAGDRRRFINDLNFLGLGSDDASSMAGASPIFRQPIVGAARQAKYIQEANKARQAANANKAVQATNYAQQEANYIKELNDRLAATMRNVGEKLGVKLNPNPNKSVRRLYSSKFKPTTNSKIATSKESPISTTNNTTTNNNNYVYSGKTTKFNSKYRNYRNAGFSPKTSENLVKANRFGLYGTVGGLGSIGVGTLIGANVDDNDNNDNIKTNKSVSPYIARPNVNQTSTKQTKKDTTTQIPDTIKRPTAKKDSVRRDSVKPTRTITKLQQKVAPIKQDTTRVDTAKQVKTVSQQKKTTTPQYKGNVTKGNYQLHDGETKVINGIKYSRVGNNIINHKTNVAYVYDKNGNYTGQADYSKVGKNFNDAFDAARAAGRSQFIYRAGKYNNYSTAKEENAKKEARNRAIGARRIAKRFGGLELPRRRALNGTDVNFNEVDVTARNKRRFNNWDNYMLNNVLNNIATPNVSYQKAANTSKVQSYLDLMSTPYAGRQSSFKPATQDYVGLGIDTLAALGSGILGRRAYNKLNFDYNIPSYVDETPVAFDTTYHNEAQQANVERNRINSRNLIQGNTASAQTALSRMQSNDTNAMMELNKLADEKANKEVELRNQNATNEQQVRARNAAARNQYYQTVAQIKNSAIEAKNNAALAKAQSIGTDLSGLAQAWSNFATSIENRYDSRQNQIAAIARTNNPAIAQTALSMGYDFSPEALAGLYNVTSDNNIKKLILSRLSNRDRIKYGIQ